MKFVTLLKRFYSFFLRLPRKFRIALITLVSSTLSPFLLKKIGLEIVVQIIADWVTSTIFNLVLFDYVILLFGLFALFILFRELKSGGKDSESYLYPKVRIALMLGLILLTFTSMVGVVFSKSGFPPQPTITPAPTPTTTTDPIKQCLYVDGEWPCYDYVLDSEPRDTLYAVVYRNYRVSADKVEYYANLICEANYDFLIQQFVDRVPVNEQKVWKYDPCNFLIAGNKLIIPVPPVTP